MRLRVEVAKRELTDRQEVGKYKQEFCVELKRKTALQAILKTLNVIKMCI